MAPAASRAHGCNDRPATASQHASCAPGKQRLAVPNTGHQIDWGPAKQPATLPPHSLLVHLHVGAHAHAPQQVEAAEPAHDVGGRGVACGGGGEVRA
jgi:hypothetical protein